MVEIATYGTG